MSVRSTHHRLATGLIAGLALTLAPAVAMSSASAAPDPDPIEPPTALRLDLSVPAVVGEIAVTWNASPTAGITDYGISYTYEDGSGDYETQPASDRTFTVENVEPGESVDIEVRAGNEETSSPTATLRVTGLDSGPNYSFTDTAGNTFRYEISWLSTSRITTGYDANGSRSFRPSQPVLREQMAAFLYRYAGSPDVDTSGPSPFTDVPKSATFYKEILWLANEEISTGYDEAGGTKTFRPSQPVLREQMAAFLYRYDGTGFTSEAQTFTDAPNGATFHDEIEWLANEGISTGYDAPGDTRVFRGGDAVLREQMAAFLYRYNNGDFGDNYIIN